MLEDLIYDREEFTFGGVHCDAHNAAFIADSWPVAAEPEINKYEIPGRHGTIRFPGTWLKEQLLEGRLYLLSETGEPITYHEMLLRKTEISTWLRPGGRKQLIMDAANDRFYMAEIEHALIIYTDDWGNGRIDIAFTCQPFTYAIREDTADATLDGASAQNAALTVRGNQPAPIAMRLVAGAALTWVQLTLGGDTLRLENMSLTMGQELLITYDLDSGELMAISHNGSAGMQYMTASSPDEGLKAAPGANTISVNADAACAVELTARGRWQ